MRSVGYFHRGAKAALLVAALMLWGSKAGAEEFSTGLVEGWNLISIPFDASGVTLSQVLGGLEAPAFAMEDGEYLAVGGSEPLDDARGYWVLLETAAAVSVSGTGNSASTPVTVNLSAGWNMIGNPYNETVDWGHNIRFDDESVLVSTRVAAGPYYFDPAVGYVEAESLTPWRGCWIKVTDAGALKFSTIANNPPTAHAGEDRQVIPGTAVVLDGSGSHDPDGDDLYYQWTQVSGPSVALSNPASVSPNFTPLEDGEYVFSLTVNDGDLYSAPDTVTALVGNEPPVADAGPEQRVLPGTEVTLDGSGSYDPEGEPLTYSWTQTQGPEVTLSDPTAVNPTFTPDELGTRRFRLEVSDGVNDPVTDTVRIHVSNLPPVAHAGEDIETTPGELVTLDGSGSYDPEGQELTYQWTQVSGLTVELSDPTAVDPSFLVPDYGEFVFRLIVNDGVNDSSSVFVTVTTVNAPPVAVAGEDFEAIRYQETQLDGTASWDPDGDELEYAWTQVEGEECELNDEDTAEPMFKCMAFGVYEFQLVVYDGHQYSEPDTVTVTIGNHAPVAHAGEDMSVSRGLPAALDGTGSYDIDGDPLDYDWTQLSGPGVALSGAQTAAPTFTPGEYAVLEFQLTVFDGEFYSEPDTVVVTVENQPPVAVAGEDMVGYRTEPVTLDGGDSYDPEGDELEYAWTQTLGPAVELSGADEAVAGFTPTELGEYGFELVVFDGGLYSEPDAVTVTVANRPPVADAGPDQPNAIKGQPVTLDGTASYDPDGDPIVSYSWTQALGPDVTLSDPSAPQPGFTPSDHASYHFELVVSDGELESEPDLVKVLTPNVIPVAVGSLSVTGGNAPLHVVVDAISSYDVDGTVESYYYDCNGDGSFEQQSTQPIHTCLYGYPVSFAPRLRVEDNLGALSAAITLDTVTVTSNYDSYMPLNLDHFWMYEVYGTLAEVPTKVTHQVYFEDKWYFNIQSDDPDFPRYMREDETGLYWFDPEYGADGAELKGIEYPLVVGNTWILVDDLTGEAAAKLTMTVKAGVFEDCYRIVYAGVAILYFCKDVGVVENTEYQLVLYDFN